ncbi:mCG1030747, isoform CRA_a [Mus musculus]|nr:mCG1030747, isoform CRA_a [Mus musculus]EDL20295.1 mCG1030747, isoform CRA_a [Mus musculus]
MGHGWRGGTGALDVTWRCGCDAQQLEWDCSAVLMRERFF